ncbi:pore-forming ESAT-6 family protein [Microbacterium sp. RU33B]|uniref:pore-forming ESAT-6 family protein n=1 Tax=Microbacterium sp. RU33B TaxID=1907390 RepID=UPI00095AD4AF|nr:pore-forming ESAT-6 family protein [Microbacterium sp. RU33B]SIT89002.1 hypothetical protein SAMN05880545_3107 [Microbacterium sp. RU33B]
MPQSDRVAFDINDSQSAQTNFIAVATRLEQLIAERDKQVKTAMADAIIDGADATYLAKEQRWTTISENTKSIVQALKQAMTDNDATAQSALSKAKAAVDAIA